MPFPLFASLTTISSPLWDTAYAQLNLQSLYPCTVAGTNAITLTGSANAPAISAYVPNQSFLGIVTGTNTGAVTAQFGSLPALPVYKDSAAGPVALTGGEQFLGNKCIWTYDSALNSGGGGFHLETGPAGLVGAYLPLAGGTITGNLTVNGIFKSASVASLAAVNVSGLFTGATINASGPVSLASTLQVVGLFTGTTLNASGPVSLASTLQVVGLFTGTTINATGPVSVASLQVGTAASVGTLTVAAGNSVTRLLSAAASLSFAALAPAATVDATIALAGCSINDVVMVGPPSASVGLVVMGFVSAASIVTVRVANVTAGTITPAGGTHRVTAMGFS